MRCARCWERIPADAQRYVDRNVPARQKCVRCVMIEANAGQDVTKELDDPERFKKAN